MIIFYSVYGVLSGVLCHSRVPFTTLLVYSGMLTGVCYLGLITLSRLILPAKEELVPGMYVIQG